MRIPSYDDLTPSIPDVSTAAVHEAVAQLLPESSLVAHVARPVRKPRTTDDGCRTTEVYACLRSVRHPEAILAIAREFSPRIQRYPEAVVLDVSGLGRLLGPPAMIGLELARSVLRSFDGACGSDAAQDRSVDGACGPGAAQDRSVDGACGPGAAQDRSVGGACGPGAAQDRSFDGACGSGAAQDRSFDGACGPGAAQDRPVDRQVPRYVSRYGLRIEPHPSEHGRVCASQAIDDDATPADIDAGEEEAGRAIESTGIRVAVAPTQIGALLLTLDAHPLTIAGAESSGTRSLAARLERLPLRSLQQFMVGVHGATLLRGRKRAKPAVPPSQTSRWPSWAGCEHTFDVLHRWGLTTLGEFIALPSAELSARTGQAGVALQRLARGTDPGPLIPDPDVPRYLQRMELEWPIDGLEPLSFVLARMIDPLSAALERADRAAAAIRLDLRLVDRTTYTRQLQLPVAMRDPRVLRTLLLLDLESHPPHAAIDIVTIEADPAPGRVVQYSLLDRALPSAETLATLTARLHALVGETRCGSPVLLDTHRPDAFRMESLAPALSEGYRPPRVEGPALSEGYRPPRVEGPAPSEGQRPPRVEGPAPSELKNAPRVEGSEGYRPSRVEGPAGILRRFRPPVAVRVRVERGRPVHLAIDRRGMPGGAIVQAAGPWRSSGDWWTGRTPWDRDEWDVELRDGVLCRLFRERESGMWFLDGVVD